MILEKEAIQKPDMFMFVDAFPIASTTPYYLQHTATMLQCDFHLGVLNIAIFASAFLNGWYNYWLGQIVMEFMDAVPSSFKTLDDQDNQKSGQTTPQISTSVKTRQAF